MLKFSEPEFDYNTLTPYINIEFKDKLSLDRELFSVCRIYKENIISIIVDGYRQALEKQLPEELKKYDLEIYREKE